MSNPSFVRPVALVVVASVLMLVGPAVSPAHASLSGSYEHAVTKYTNAERTKRDLKKVAKSKCLDRFAESQARAMAKKQKLYHQQLKPILARCKLREVGENVAFGYPSGKAATTGWMGSPGHKKNLLNKVHRLIGVGAYQDTRGQWYVAQVLGRHL